MKLTATFVFNGTPTATAKEVVAAITKAMLEEGFVFNMQVTGNVTVTKDDKNGEDD